MGRTVTQMLLPTQLRVCTGGGTEQLGTASPADVTKDIPKRKPLAPTDPEKHQRTVHRLNLKNVSSLIEV